MKKGSAFPLTANTLRLLSGRRCMKRTAIAAVCTSSGPHLEVLPSVLGTAGAPRWDVINQWLSDPPQWSPDSKYITRVAKMNKAAKWQIWRWSVDGGTPLQLTDVPGDVQTYHWTPQGDKIVVTFEKPRDTVQIQRLSEDGILYDGGFIPSRDRPVVSEVLASKRQETETWIHDVTTGEERKQTKAEAESVGPWVSDIGEAILRRNYKFCRSSLARCQGLARWP